MKRRTWNFLLLVLFLVATVGSGAQAPGQDRAAKGWWGDVLTWPVAAWHMVVLKNGKVLAFGGAGEPTICLLFDPPRCNGGANDTLPCNIDADCSGGVCTYNVTSFPGPDIPRHLLYCTGHTALADGKIFFTGTAPLSETTTLYDPDVDPPGPASWIPQDDGSGGPDVTERFYPTCTLQGDGTVLVTAGRHFSGPGQVDNFEADTPAIYVPNRPAGLQWRSLSNATYADRTPGICPPAGDFHIDQYPFMFLLSTGKTVYAGSDDAWNVRRSTLGTWTLDTQAEVWTELVSAANDTIFGGSAVMYRPDLIMKAGGRGADCNSAIASVSALDTKAMPPVWTSLAPMGNVRENHIYLLVLPDGNILATNGENDADDAVLEPELYDPEVDVWELMAAMDVERTHHSTAVLLPDARVLVAGDTASAQIFSPPYLWNTDDTLADRPIIDSVDAVVSRGFPSSDIIEYGKPFTVTFSQALEIATVSLIRPGSATHGFDFEQRFMELTIEAQEAGVLTLTAPATPNEAPPGYYMLFILDNSGVPSVATMIKLSPPFTPKNRYLSFVPDDAHPLAFQLKPTPNPENKTWWVDVPEFVNGIYRSYLTDTPVLRTWSEGVVHIGDCRVVPAAGYELRATTEGNTFTEPLSLSTIELPAPKFWGDVVSSFINNVWGPPQGVVNIDDAVAAIQGFQELPTAPPLPWVDVEPEDLNQLVNFNDVFQIILAFSGNPYPFSAPEDCPGSRSAPPVIGDPATFTLVAGSPEIEPGETVDIEVFISTLADLGGYQVTLEVSGGTSGGLMLADVTVDSTHADYVFNGLSAVTFPDVPRARVGNALIGTPSGVPVSDPGYLATFSYVPCESAYGDFHVSVVVGQDDTSLMDSSATRLAYNGGSCTVLGVGIDCNVDSDCDDSNECTIETCENNACTFSYEVSGTACDDGLFCSATSECDGNGTCAGSGSPCPPRDPVCCEMADNCIAVGDDCSTAPT